MNIIKALLGKMDVLELKFRKKNEKANDSILSALMENRRATSRRPILAGTSRTRRKTLPK